MSKEKNVVVIVISPEEKREETYKQPNANWYFVDAVGNTVFLRHKDKSKCEAYLTENYGKGKYKLHPCKLKKPEGEISCRGSMNSKSRSGAYMQQIKSSQGSGL